MVHDTNYFCKSKKRATARDLKALENGVPE